MKWTPFGFFFEKNELGHIRPNRRYYELVMHTDYGKKIRQHGNAQPYRGVHLIYRFSQCNPAFHVLNCVEL